MPESTIAERVAAGMAWLDAERPGWERRIDLATFNMSDGCLCVLGQTLRKEARGMSGFHYAYRFFGNDDDQMLQLGFTDARYRWSPLEAEWAARIKERFDTGRLSDDGASNDTTEALS